MEKKEYELIEKPIAEAILKCLADNPGIENEISWFSIKASEAELELA